MESDERCVARASRRTATSARSRHSSRTGTRRWPTWSPRSPRTSTTRRARSTTATRSSGRSRRAPATSSRSHSSTRRSSSPGERQPIACTWRAATLLTFTYCASAAIAVTVTVAKTYEYLRFGVFYSTPMTKCVFGWSVDIEQYLVIWIIRATSAVIPVQCSRCCPTRTTKLPRARARNCVASSAKSAQLYLFHSVARSPHKLRNSSTDAYTSTSTSTIRT